MKAWVVVFMLSTSCAGDDGIPTGGLSLVSEQPVEMGNLVGQIGHHALIGSRGDARWNVWDASDPATPVDTDVRLVAGDGMPDVFDGRAWLFVIAETEGSFEVWDLPQSGPVEPVLFASATGLEIGNANGVEGDRLVTCSLGGCRVYEIAGLAEGGEDLSVVEGPTITMPGRGFTDVEVMGDHAMLCTDGAGVQVWSITEPAEMLYLLPPGPGLSGSNCGGLLRDGDTIYAFGGFDLTAIDVSDPAAPTVLGTIAGPNTSARSLDGDQLVGSIRSSLAVFDVSDPAAMRVDREMPILSGAPVAAAVFPGHVLMSVNQAIYLVDGY